MSNIISSSNVKEASFEGVVIRCGCTDKQKQCKEWHGFKQEPCPNPKQVQNLGKLAYYSSNPFKLMFWKIKQLFKR